MINPKIPLCLGLLAIQNLPAAPPPPGLDLEFKSPSDLRLTARDRKNGAWLLQYSADMQDWKSYGKILYVRNSLAPVPTSGLPDLGDSAYFRLVPLPAIRPERTISHMLALPPTPYSYSTGATVPAALRDSFLAVKIDDAKATLGRVLFYDRRLSLDNSVSCASCHRQEHGFADSVPLSRGHLGVPTLRNSMSLQQVRSYVKSSALFWDLRSPSLESAVLDPISHPDEMGLSMTSMLQKIQGEQYYKELFTNAFGGFQPTSSQIGVALADFIESMASFNSKYDQGIAGNFSNFTPGETAGKVIFGNHCASCHGTHSFTSGSTSNNGLDLVYADPGRQAITGRPEHNGHFRVPSLRQIGLTAPYMHDGRFATLREVIEFYNQGVARHPNLGKGLTGEPLNLDERQKADLEAFLRTATDTAITTNPAFSDPFRTD